MSSALLSLKQEGGLTRKSQAARERLLGKGPSSQPCFPPTLWGHRILTALPTWGFSPQPNPKDAKRDVIPSS